MKALLIGLVACLLTVSAAHAEQMKQLGKWDVHYMAVNTTFLTPEVARAYDITRSKNKVLINISVLDHRSSAAQDVSVSGQARTLMGATIPLTFKQVNDGDAIYYLAVMDIDNREHYRFAIDIQQGNQQQTLKFEQKLFAE
ncbi:DUF4426 domain-containing protein [Aestuariibacter halophilus]|uniref:DUF4426 domain-containing protein n=1 Tax=Fluctibacter halophilus TaxID=226011 RepID=A0ABS8GBR1_9ALTE|nr:DUF4426 domain-containing protein [Aestuariibacter halophilus]MCC2618022.1 DUF4426 domain-containing protein [Aestuariibacter halophilus]